MTPEGRPGSARSSSASRRERPKISREIGVAREHGDLSENAEYHAAKGAPGAGSRRASRTSRTSSRAPRSSIPTKLSGTKVALRRHRQAHQPRYRRGVALPNRRRRRGRTSTRASISISAPLARALIGKEVGDEVKVRMPAGERSTRSSRSSTADAGAGERHVACRDRLAGLERARRRGPARSSSEWAVVGWLAPARARRRVGAPRRVCAARAARLARRRRRRRFAGRSCSALRSRGARSSRAWAWRAARRVVRRAGRLRRVAAGGTLPRCPLRAAFALGARGASRRRRRVRAGARRASRVCARAATARLPLGAGGRWRSLELAQPAGAAAALSGVSRWVWPRSSRCCAPLVALRLRGLARALERVAAGRVRRAPRRCCAPVRRRCALAPALRAARRSPTTCGCIFSSTRRCWRCAVELARASSPPPAAARSRAARDGEAPRRAPTRDVDWRDRDIAAHHRRRAARRSRRRYGYARPTTPSIDALAREGVLFEHAYCPTPHTSYSVTSLMTGKYMRPLLAAGRSGSDSDTWAGLLRTYGYRTAAFYPPAVFFIDEERFERFAIAGSTSSTARSSSPTRTSARAQVEALPRHAPADQPLFLWVHLFEPHEPYDAHPEHAFGDRDIDRYDTEIAAADDGIGADRAQRCATRRPSAVVIVTADHGEEFGEHGGRYHGTTVYEEQVRVPLVVARPGVRRRGASTTPVQTIDLLPTVLAALDIPRPAADARARSRPAPRRQRRPDAGRRAARSPRPTSRRCSPRAHSRLVCARKAGACALFDLARRSRRDARHLARRSPSVSRRMKARAPRARGVARALRAARGCAPRGQGVARADPARHRRRRRRGARDRRAARRRRRRASAARPPSCCSSSSAPRPLPALRLALARDEDDDVRRWCRARAHAPRRRGAARGRAARTIRDLELAAARGARARRDRRCARRPRCSSLGGKPNACRSRARAKLLAALAQDPRQGGGRRRSSHRSTTCGCGRTWRRRSAQSASRRRAPRSPSAARTSATRTRASRSATALVQARRQARARGAARALPRHARSAARTGSSWRARAGILPHVGGPDRDRLARIRACERHAVLRQVQRRRRKRSRLARPRAGANHRRASGSGSLRRPLGAGIAPATAQRPVRRAGSHESRCRADPAAVTPRRVPAEAHADRSARPRCPPISSRGCRGRSLTICRPPTSSPGGLAVVPLSDELPPPRRPEALGTSLTPPQDKTKVARPWPTIETRTSRSSSSRNATRPRAARSRSRRARWSTTRSRADVAAPARWLQEELRHLAVGHRRRHRAVGGRLRRLRLPFASSAPRRPSADLMKGTLERARAHLAARRAKPRRRERRRSDAGLQVGRRATRDRARLVPEGDLDVPRHRSRDPRAYGRSGRPARQARLGRCACRRTAT